MTEQSQESTFQPMWAMVELMGHTRVAGRISEESHFGVALMRCDIPTGPEDYFTQWYGGPAIFRVTPISEDTARSFTAGNRPQPVRPYELAALPAPVRPAAAPMEDYSANYLPDFDDFDNDDLPDNDEEYDNDF